MRGRASQPVGRKRQDFSAQIPLALTGACVIVSNVELFLSICLGVGLSAACGFRVFVPLLCLSIAAHFGAGHVYLAKSFAWIGSSPAMIAFGIATLVEII